MAVREGRINMVQCDGSTMDSTEHGVDALAIARLVQTRNPGNLIVICSGGCGPITWKIAEMAGIPISGLGMGIASRLRFRHLLRAPDLFDNPEYRTEAIQIGLRLRGEIPDIQHPESTGHFVGGAAMMKVQMQTNTFKQTCHKEE
jgi:hypothetical protein